MTEIATPDNGSPTTAVVSGKPNAFDILFLIFLTCMLAIVAWVGMLSYEEGVKNKTTIQHGEAWVAWLGRPG